MQLALEIPVKYIGLFRDITDFDYALAHKVLENEEYAQRYADRRGRVLILDNSVNELGKPVPVKKLFKAAKIVKPDLIVAPDVEGDATKTIDNFLELMKRNLPCAVMGVIQGKTLDECKGCLEAFTFFKEFFCCGIPCDVLCKKTDPVEQMSITRKAVVELAVKYRCPVHLLGVSTPEELVEYKDNKFVKSVDTGTPFLYGLKGLRFGEVTLGKELVDLDAEISGKQWANIFYNIAYLRKYMSD